MFVFFSSGLGWIVSILISIAGTVLVLALMGVL
jgi:hypothetical protein